MAWIRTRWPESRVEQRHDQSALSHVQFPSEDRMARRDPDAKSQISKVIAKVPLLRALSLEDFQLPPKSVFDKTMPRYPNVWFYVDTVVGAFLRAGGQAGHGAASLAMQLREDYGPFGNPEGCDFEVRLEHLQPWEGVSIAPCNIRTLFTCVTTSPRLRDRNWSGLKSVRPGGERANSTGLRPAHITKSSTQTQTTPMSRFARSAAALENTRIERKPG